MQNSAKRAIFFCGSIRAGRQDVDLYQRIIDRLGEYGRVLTPFVGDKTITIVGSEHTGGDKGIHDRDVEMLEESNGKLLKSFNLFLSRFIAKKFDFQFNYFCHYVTAVRKISKKIL